MRLCLIQAIKLTEHSNQMFLDRLSKEIPRLISYLLGSYPNLKVKDLKVSWVRLARKVASKIWPCLGEQTNVVKQ